MKRLVCEMCGSADLVKDEGVFVCQSCGCKYSVAEARKMMTEETVQVEWTVQFDPKAQVESMGKNAKRLYDEKKYSECYAACADLLKLDPSSPYGLLYSILSENVEPANSDVAWPYDVVEEKIASALETAAGRMGWEAYAEFCEAACRSYGRLVDENVGYARVRQKSIPNYLVADVLAVQVASNKNDCAYVVSNSMKRAELECELENASKRAEVLPKEREAHLLSLGIKTSPGVEGEIDARFLAYVKLMANYNGSLSEWVDGVERSADEGARLEKNYQAACRLEQGFYSDHTDQKFLDAIALFDKVGDYKDARTRRESLEKEKAKAAEEERRAKAEAAEEERQARIRAEQERKDKVYNDALADLESQDPHKLKEASKALSDLGDWKDASEKANEAAAKAGLMIRQAQKKRKKAILITITVMVVAAIGVVVAKMAMDNMEIENAKIQIEDAIEDAKKAYAGMAIQGSYDSTRSGLRNHTVWHIRTNNTLTFSEDDRMKLHLVEYVKKNDNKEYPEDFDRTTAEMTPVDCEVTYSASEGEVRYPSESETGGVEIKYSGFSDPKLTRVTVYVRLDNIVEARVDYDNTAYGFMSKVPSIGNVKSISDMPKVPSIGNVKPSSQTDKSAYEGEWVLESGSDEHLTEGYVRLLESQGLRITMELEGDGTGSLNIPGNDATDFTWAVENGEATATANGKKASLRFEDEKLVLADDAGSSMTFVRPGEASKGGSAETAGSSRINSGNSSTSSPPSNSGKTSRDTSSDDSLNYKGGDYEYQYTNEDGESMYYDPDTGYGIWVDKDGNKEWTDGYGNHHPV